MKIDNFWETCFRCVETVYRERSGLLRSATVALMSDDPTFLCYEQTKHHICFNEDFLNAFNSCSSVNDELFLLLGGIHECLHAISFRKIRKDEKGDVYYLGLRRRTIINGDTKEYYLEWLNEYMTDHLAFRVMEKTLSLKVVEWRQAPEHRLVDALMSKVGLNVLNRAYFDGKFEEFTRALGKRRVDCQKLFQLLDFSSAQGKMPSDQDRAVVLEFLKRR